MRRLVLSLLIPLLLTGCGGGLLPAQVSPTASPREQTATLDVVKLFRAKLVFQPALDSTGSDFSNPIVLGDPSHNRIEQGAGSVDFYVFSPSVGRPGLVAADLVSMPALERYVAQVTVTFSSREIELAWSIRRGDDAAIGDHVVWINAWQREFELDYIGQAAIRKGDSGEAMAPASPQQHIVGGRPYQLTAVVDPPHYMIYLGRVQLIDACDSLAGRHTQQAKIGFTVRPGRPGMVSRGSASVTDIRIFSLPPVLPYGAPASRHCPGS